MSLHLSVHLLIGDGSGWFPKKKLLYNLIILEFSMGVKRNWDSAMAMVSDEMYKVV